MRVSGFTPSNIFESHTKEITNEKIKIVEEGVIFIKLIKKGKEFKSKEAIRYLSNDSQPKMPKF